MQQKLARDRSDYDLRFGEHRDWLEVMDKQFNDRGSEISVISVIISNLVENINMQMEAETSDLLDRRMMQLFAASHNKLEKADVQNASINLAKARNGDA